MKNILKVIHKKKILALIIKGRFKKGGIEFFTPPHYSQQLSYMNWPKGHSVASHIHSQVVRKIKFTFETLFIKNGKVRIDFYDEKKHYIESRILLTGDVVLFAFGGHGLEFMKNSEIIEVKQGPYLNTAQTIRFNPVAKHKLKVKE